MSYCAPVCSVPCGVGYGYGGVGYGYGSIGSCGLVPAYGAGGALSGVGVGGALSGVGAGYGYGPVACSSQLAGSEVVIQPPASVVSIPGPTISSTGDPALVSAITPCSGYGYAGLGSGAGFSSGSSSGGYGRLGYCGGYGGYRRYSRRCLPYYSSGSCGPC